MACRLLQEPFRLEALHELAKWRAMPLVQRQKRFSEAMTLWTSLCHLLNGRVPQPIEAWTYLADLWAKPIHLALDLETPWSEYLAAGQLKMAMGVSKSLEVRSIRTLLPLWAWLAVATLPGLVLHLPHMGVHDLGSWRAEMEYAKETSCGTLREFLAYTRICVVGKALVRWHMPGCQSSLILPLLQGSG